MAEVHQGPSPAPSSRPKIVSVFRYPLHEHEAMANTYPYVLKTLAEQVDVHHFSYASPAPHWLTGSPGIEIHEFPIRVRRSSEFDKWFKTLLWYLMGFRIGWWARRNRADLIYLEDAPHVLPLIVKWASGRPVAASVSDFFWDMYIPDRPFWRPLRRLFLAIDGATWKRLAGIVTHTRAMKAFVCEHGFPASRAAVVPEACKQDRFFRMDRAEARRHCGFKEGELILLHHGILHPNKALDRIFAFIKPTLLARPDVRIVIVGDGPARRGLEQLSRDLGLADKIEFRGWLPDSRELNTYLNAADVSLVMRAGNFSDHFQVTANLLHSLACGTTILAANMKGMSETVHDGYNGLLFSATSGEDFRSKLDQLLASPELRARLADQALRTATEQLTPERITALWAGSLLHMLRNEPIPPEAEYARSEERHP